MRFAILVLILLLFSVKADAMFLQGSVPLTTSYLLNDSNVILTNDSNAKLVAN